MTSMDPTGAVVITTKDIYDKLTELEKSVTLMTPQAQTMHDHETRLRAVENLLPDDLERRIRSLEKWKWSIPPTAIAAIIAIAQQVLTQSRH